jgi:hypothetical protein
VGDIIKHQFVFATLTEPWLLDSWGESAGSQSVSLHMLVNNGNPNGLFRAAIMVSHISTPPSDLLLKFILRCRNQATRVHFPEYWEDSHFMTSLSMQLDVPMKMILCHAYKTFQPKTF